MKSEHNLSSVNKLVLIGNGFDLGCGLKTSYKDFIYWYMMEALDEFDKNSRYDDELITLKSKTERSIIKPKTWSELSDMITKDVSDLSIEYKVNGGFFNFLL